MSDDRPKKSWREIDRSREKGGSSGPRRDPEAWNRERISKTAAYSKYKSNLDKLFGPGGAELPESMKSQLGPASEESKEKRALLDALKATPNADTLRAYLAKEPVLPEDPRLLTGLLDVRDDALLRPVLERLLEIIEGGKKPNRMLLIQRLEAIKNFAEDAGTLELAQMVRAALD
jgi:hypothetical protein